jgi:hypothetical protein
VCRHRKCIQPIHLTAAVYSSYANRQCACKWCPRPHTYSDADPANTWVQLCHCNKLSPTVGSSVALCPANVTLEQCCMVCLYQSTCLLTDGAQPPNTRMQEHISASELVRTLYLSPTTHGQTATGKSNKYAPDESTTAHHWTGDLSCPPPPFRFTTLAWHRSTDLDLTARPSNFPAHLDTHPHTPHHRPSPFPPPKAASKGVFCTTSFASYCPEHCQAKPQHPQI